LKYCCKYYSFALLMRYKIFISKCIACFLLLLFTQKIGAGLYLHNYLHASSGAKETSTNNGHSTVNYSCNCIDDFAMPFTAGETIAITVGVITLGILFFFFRKQEIRAAAIHLALRGPPALA